MKFSKFLLIMGITTLLLVCIINTSFAASSEHVTKYKQYKWENCNKKIITINHFEVSDENYDSKSSYKINIKKYCKNKYKIKSVNLKYGLYDDTEFSGYFYKNYTIKNKNSITIKDPKKNMYLIKATVKYHTKNKLNKESFYFHPSGKWKRTVYYYGAKFKGSLREKGYIKKEYGCDGGIGYGYAATTNKLKISTKNTKYKIDKVKLLFVGGHADTLERTKTYKAYGKNRLTVNSYGNYEASWLADFRVYFR